MAGATLYLPVAAESRHFVGHIPLLRQLAERPGGGGGSEAMTKKINNIMPPPLAPPRAGEGIP